MSYRDTGVLPRRADPDVTPLVVGAPVSARTWGDIGRLLHYVRGRGRMLVPYTFVNDALSSGVAYTARFRTAPSGVAITRVWIVAVRGVSLDFGSEITLQAGGAAARTFPIGFWRPSYLVYLEDGCTKTTAATDLAITITADANCVLEGIACYELPRAVLTPTTDLGVHLDSLYPRRSIYSSAEEGIDAIARGILATKCRRIGLFGWWGAEMNTVSTSNVDTWSFPIPVVPALDAFGTTQRKIVVTVWCWVSNATTAADFTFVAGSGDSDVLSLPAAAGSTTPQWLTGSLDVDAEDLSSADGDAGDTVQLQVKRTSGAGTVKWQGACGFEGP